MRATSSFDSLTVLGFVAVCSSALAGCRDSDAPASAGGPGGSTTSNSSASSTASSTVAGSSAGGAGGSASAVDTFSDEFDDASTFGDWAIGPSDVFASLDIDSTTPGHLTVLLDEKAFWNDSGQGFLFFKTLAGDFALHTRVAIASIDKPGTIPTGAYHAAGIMVRDPVSDQGTEFWLTYDFGRQWGARRSTRLALTSLSKTGIQKAPSDIDVRGGELVVCRVDGVFYFARRFEGETAWTTTDTSSMYMPPSVQVGLSANAGGGTPDLFATFDYARLTIPTTAADCVADE